MKGERAHNDPEKPVRDWLPIIDKVMLGMNVPLSQRPFKAAVFFVKECIVRIKGDSKEEYWRKGWFSDIHRSIYAWYTERYGNALKAAGARGEDTLVVIYGLPFRVMIPLRITESDEAGEPFWLIFPNSVFANEDVLGWLVTPPNLEQLSPEEMNDVREQIVRSATLIRSIHVDLLTAELAAGPMRERGCLGPKLR